MNKLFLVLTLFITGCTTSQIYTSSTYANNINELAQTFIGPGNAISQSTLNYQTDVRQIMGVWNDPEQALMFLPQYYIYR
jgi:hypothetical protein